MRIAGPADTPDLSVIALLFVGREYLVRCLEALERQDSDACVELIVAHDDLLTGAGKLAQRFPGVRFASLPGRRSPAELRAHAVDASRAPVVALIEDHCVARADWCARILEAHGQPRAAIGGAVEKGNPPGRTRDSGLAWALYLTDYSRYMPPLAGGPAPSLTDCNVSYKRRALERCRDAWRPEFHENVVHGLLTASGERLWLDPDIVVFEQRTLPLAAVLRDRFAFGRLFGSTRVAGASAAVRLRFAAGALAMPPVLVLRAGRNVFARRRHRADYFRALPALTLTTSTWMLGEFAGYLTGRPPDPGALAVGGASQAAPTGGHRDAAPSP
jgi:hypothetical protein